MKAHKQGEAEQTQFCPQCYRDKPVEAFLSVNGKRQVRQCTECRARYNGWQLLSVAERRDRMKPKPRTGIGFMVTFAHRSGNRKTGPMPVSMTDMQSCASSCPMRDKGCYAEFGKLRFHWERVATRGISWRDFCGEVAALLPDTLWRHNEAGDLPGRGDELDVVAFRQLVSANAKARARGFTFTHKPLTTALERDAVRCANEKGFTVNLSADSLAHADDLLDLAVGPVAVVLPTDAPQHGRTPKGRAVVVCLNETQGLTCAECELCAKADRHSVVGFRAHGQAKEIVSDLVALRRKPAALPHVAEGA